MGKLDKTEILSAQNSKERACVFIDSSDPLYPNQVINGSSHPCFKPPFPPNINPRDLIAKQSSNGRIMARAPNAFIIYRKLCVETARSHGYYLPMTVISSMTSQSWEEESSVVKAEYKRIAQEANKYHKEMYPKTGRRKKRERWNLVSFQPKSYLQEDSSKTINITSLTPSSSELKNSNPPELSPLSDQTRSGVSLPINSINNVSSEKSIKYKLNNNNEINPIRKAIYPSPDISADNHQEMFSSKDIEQFQSPLTNVNSTFNLEYPSPNLSPDGFFDLGSLANISNIYGEEISGWHGQSLSRINSIPVNTFPSCHRRDVNYESNRLENSNANNTLEGFNLSDNLNVSFSYFV